MAHAYCTGCEAHVTVVDGRCLLDHRIDPATVSTSSGRRVKSRRAGRPDPVPTSPPPPPPTVDPRPPTEPDRFELDLRTEEIALTTPKSPPVPQSAPAGARLVDDRPTAPMSAVAVAERPSSLVPTGHLVAELWADQSPAADLIDDWMPGTIDTDVRVVARRVLLSTLIVIAAAVIGAASWFLAGRGDASLAKRLSEVETASTGLATSLTDAGQSISDLADGSIDDPDLLARSISAIDDASRSTFTAAAELPAEGEQAALRRGLIETSDQALELSRDLSRISAYASSVSVMLNRPAFPFEATDTDLAMVAEQAATWINRFLSMSASLPDAPGMSEHREAIDAMSTMLPGWQADYLDALRSGDTVAAGELIAGLEQRALDLGDGLETALAAIAQELSLDQAEILSDLG